MRESWLKYKRPQPVRVPNGVFALEIRGHALLGTRRTWKEGKHQRVGKCLNDFVAELFATADAAERHREEQDRRRRKPKTVRVSKGKQLAESAKPRATPERHRPALALRPKTDPRQLR